MLTLLLATLILVGCGNSDEISTPARIEHTLSEVESISQPQAAQIVNYSQEIEISGKIYKLSLSETMYYTSYSIEDTLYIDIYKLLPRTTELICRFKLTTQPISEPYSLIEEFFVERIVYTEEVELFE